MATLSSSSSCLAIQWRHPQQKRQEGSSSRPGSAFLCPWKPAPSSLALNCRWFTPPLVLAQKTDEFKAIGTAVKIARDFVDAGAKLVPASIPRPLAQAGVSAVGVIVALFFFKSLFSTLLFILAIGGISYFIFLSVFKDEGPGSGSGSGSYNKDDPLEEARRIMEKYK